MRILSKYISEADAVRSQTASRFNILNKFNDTTFANARIIAEMIDCIVDYYKNNKSSKCSLVLSSFLRVPELNIKIGGSKTSEHVNGNAADINIVELQPTQIFNDIISGRILDSNKRPLKFKLDQVILEGVSKDGRGGWVHIGRRSNNLQRNMFLIAHFNKGIATYTQVYKEV